MEAKIKRIDTFHPCFKFSAQQEPKREENRTLRYNVLKRRQSRRQNIAESFLAKKSENVLCFRSGEKKTL